MITTKQWAASHGIGVDDSLPPVADYNEPVPRTSQEAAVRTVILHAIAATGYGVAPKPIVEWLIDQSIWQHASPAEQKLLEATAPTDEELSEARSRQEAQWALLWTTGVPVHGCLRLKHAPEATIEAA
ncbi:DUF4272 domain-containing protein [Aureliella helgolandensis]|uniref:Uncharacterized protein n=1 Tax=Aureliella helgolandensis TaxID=2527968 RepID=A0A518G9H7_9BACT|nr:DUF4272 domain-containing protein [Aureliella helgolandensis]QDV25241.1 hypothetical protein Q31a_35640 [Aureliella helgolandensis]